MMSAFFLVAALKLASCTPQGPAHPMQCARLRIPESRAHPDRIIDLNVVVIAATGPRTLPPLYDLEGGPGIAATDSAGFWVTDGAIHLRHRDMVLVDQRGTGTSAPRR